MPFGFQHHSFTSHSSLQFYAKQNAQGGTLRERRCLCLCPSIAPLHWSVRHSARDTHQPNAQSQKRGSFRRAIHPPHQYLHPATDRNTYANPKKPAIAVYSFRSPVAPCLTQKLWGWTPQAASPTRATGWRARAMAETLPGGQPGAVQPRGGQARGGRWTLPRRSGQPQHRACSRCAGGGKPRVLPRGIAWRSQLEVCHDKCALLILQRRRESLRIFFGRWRKDLNRVLAGAVGACLPRASGVLAAAQRGSQNLVRCAGHDFLLDFGRRRATHERIIKHHAHKSRTF